MEQAIKIAIENGYLDNYLPPHGKQNYIDGFEGDWRNMVLDREFWQALGKGLGWIEVCNNPDHGFISSMPGDIGRLGCQICGHNDDFVVESTRKNYIPHWHRFIDHLADGKDINSFFEELTNKP